MELLYSREYYLVRGAVFEVYREMGPGFLEAVYQECLGREFARCGIPFVAQPGLNLVYKGERLKQTFIPDFICFGSVIVELKALGSTTGEHKAQVLNYLRATGMRVGLLANFGCYPKATIERIVR
ncbi:MAG TPA: GxxExxY protein [Noviherbaspirillum sp.]|uniref:GxxExxY protein n=1 Tax=Noviherbaspirillum sp. TaxID=1926288 RepID=UPI002B45FEA4|nr:GxxExxY protein [Noviherbaspirillum sp.]HJV84306.1 GxxExxY protein [Noviherbaspirillum sp.]